MRLELFCRRLKTRLFRLPYGRGRPEFCAAGGRLGLCLIARSELAGAPQIDNFRHGGDPRLFLPEGVDGHDLSRPSATFSGVLSGVFGVSTARGPAGAAGFIGEGGPARGVFAAGASIAGLGAAAAPGSAGVALASLATRGSSLKPNGTDGSLKPVIESKGTVSRSGLREKLRLTSNASWVDRRDPRTRAAG